MRQRMLLALDAKYTKELADAKAENDALRDDVAAGRRRLHYQQSVSQCEATAASGVDNAASPTGRHRNWDYFNFRERLITYAKQLEGTQKYTMSSADRVAHIDGQLMQLL